jgi:hypothetical protein
LLDQFIRCFDRRKKLIYKNFPDAIHKLVLATFRLELNAGTKSSYSKSKSYRFPDRLPIYRDEATEPRHWRGELRNRNPLAAGALADSVGQAITLLTIQQ